MANDDISFNRGQLESWLKLHQPVLIAFSGGVDSTLLMYSALRALGNNRFAAVTADSPSLPRRELDTATAITTALGVPHLLIKTKELTRTDYSNNCSLRCYFCRSEFYSSLKQATKETPYQDWLTIDGANCDDLTDERPGMMAAEESGVKHPFIELEFNKSDIRSLSNLLGLETWNKEESACLASRIQKGITITKERLVLVEKAEDALRALGMRSFRVRYHELGSRESQLTTPTTLARIELKTDLNQGDSYSSMLNPVNRTKITSALTKLGFDYVTLDLQGYKKGGRSIKL